MTNPSRQTIEDLESLAAEMGQTLTNLESSIIEFYEKAEKAEQKRVEVEEQLSHIRATLALLGAKPKTKKRDTPQPIPSPDNGKAKIGFREILRLILGQSKHGMKPKAVREKLEQSGFKFPGKTDPAIRVGNELRRMWKSGQLRKTKLGYKLISTNDGGS